jgi:hypothetical protein
MTKQQALTRGYLIEKRKKGLKMMTNLPKPKTNSDQ